MNSAANLATFRLDLSYLRTVLQEFLRKNQPDLDKKKIVWSFGYLLAVGLCK